LSLSLTVSAKHHGNTEHQKYLLAVLFNAPSTINGYYTALVAHDMNTGSWGPPQNR